MPTVRIEFETDNAAVKSPLQSRDALIEETRRLLMHAEITHYPDGSVHGKSRDFNGNTIGTVTVE